MTTIKFRMCFSLHKSYSNVLGTKGNTTKPFQNHFYVKFIVALNMQACSCVNLVLWSCIIQP